MNHEAETTADAIPTEPELTVSIRRFGHGLVTRKEAVAALLGDEPVEVVLVQMGATGVELARVPSPNITIYPIGDRGPIGFEIHLSSGKLVSLLDTTRFSQLVEAAQRLQIAATGALVAAGRKAARS